MKKVIKKHPEILINKVLTGKLSPLSIRWKFDRRYLDIAPIDPPIHM